MASLNRCSKATNPNRRPMSVDIRLSIQDENEKALALLDELEMKKFAPIAQRQRHQV